MRTKFYFLFLVSLLLLSARAFSQNGTYGYSVLTERPNTSIDSNINGFIEVLPVGYTSTNKYPLIIFLEGQSQFGNGSISEIKNLYGIPAVPMFPDLVKSGAFSNNYTTNNFIVLIPQARYQVKNRPYDEQLLSPSEVNDVINYALQNYSVDVNRIYLMGLSLGGGSTWNYPGQSVAYGNRVAAIVPFAGASDLAYPNHSRVTNIATANVPVWTFVATDDPIYAKLGEDYIDSIKTHPALHTTEALITVYPTGYDHDATWIQPIVYHNTGQSYTDVFRWLLGYSLGANGRAAQAQPIFANVDAGMDQTLQLPNGSMLLSTHSVSFNNATVTLNGTVTAGGPAIATIQWAKVDGVGGTITSPASPTTTVTNLKPGNYTFQLRVTDVNGLVTVDNVKVTVLAPPDNSYLKVGADTYGTKSSSNNPLIDPTFLDQGPIYGLGYWSANQWAQYTVNVPAGNYALYYRYNSAYGNPQIQITSGSTNRSFTLATIGGTGIWQSDSMHLDVTTNSTIRFTSLSSDVSSTWNLASFELALLGPESTLPVKFVYSNAQCNGNTVNLQWKTAQEQNTKEFSIQRSTDGTTWTEIGKSAAAGQSTQGGSYVFVDKNPSTNSMYRIVETDIAGQEAISTIVRSSCSSERNEVTLYPNPNTGASALNVSLAKATSITLQVLDIKGTVMQQKQIQLPAGSSTVPVNITNYPNAVYTIAVRYNGEVKTIKMIKK
jgi:dienelactone hydrolase